MSLIAGHPLYDNPEIEEVVSVNINFKIGQLALSVVENLEPSIIAFEVPLDPDNVFGNEKSVIKPPAWIIVTDENEQALSTTLKDIEFDYIVVPPSAFTVYVTVNIPVLIVSNVKDLHGVELSGIVGHPG